MASLGWLFIGAPAGPAGADVTPPAGQTPATTTGAATLVTATTATLGGTVTPGGSSAVAYRFAYGTSPTSLTSRTRLTSGPSGTDPVPVSAALTRLTPNTTYYYELLVRLNRTYYPGALESFTTAELPTVTAGAAGQLTSDSAVLAGQINPDGPQDVAYHFSYGTSPSHLDASTTPADLAPGTSPVPVSAGLSGLSPGTTYYFRLEVVVAGQTQTTSGAVQSFATPQVPVVATGEASAVTPTTTKLSGTINPTGRRR